MKRKTTSIEVFKVDGDEIMIQQNDTQSDDTFVILPAAQADLLCQWIQEVKSEIEAEQKDR